MFCKPLQRLVSLILLTSVTCLLATCSDDEASDNNLAVITVPETSLLGSPVTWIFLTNDEGKNLGDAQVAQEGVKLVFKRPKDFKGNTFTIHKLEYNTNAANQTSGFGVESYTNIKTGNFTLPEIRVAEPRVEIGQATIVMSNVPSTYQERIIGESAYIASTTGTAGTLTMKVSLAEDTEWVACFVVGYTGGVRIARYAYFSTINVGETKTVDFNELPEASRKTLPLVSEVGLAEVRVDLKGNANMDFYVIENTSSIDVYYPPEITADFWTSIQFLEENGSYDAYYRYGTIPTAMKTLPATVTSLQHEGDVVSLVTTGSYDYVELYSQSSLEEMDWEYRLGWTLYMDDRENKQFVVPDFPPAITEAFPEIVNLPTYFGNWAYLHEADPHDGYASFLEGELKGGDLYYWTYTDIAVRGIHFSPSGKQGENSRPEFAKRHR